ncbi:MAG: Ku protein [Gammaproteobacteria bacterium]
MKSDKMGRTTTITINYGINSFFGGIKKANEEQAKAIAFHTYHVKDKGEIGMSFFCKKCGEKTSKNDIIKGYNVAGQTAYFTDAELNAKFREEAGLSIIGVSNVKPTEQQIKGVYVLEPSGDKKTQANNNVMYAVLMNFLKKNDTQFVGLLKVSSRGIKKGRELALIRYNAEYNRLMIIELYYSEEIVPMDKFMGKDLSQELLDKASARLFKDIASVDISSLKENHTEKILEEVQGKLSLPQEEQIIANDDVVAKSNEEELLARLSA